MKSFKSLVSEVAQPKPEEEKRFKDQHKVDIAPHPTATEFQHKGTVKPKAKRIADQEGDANYDQAYTVKEEAEELDEISRDLARRYIRKVADKTNTGELSTKEVMKRRPGVNLAGKKAYPGVAGEPKVRATESVEQLDELSPNTLKSYTKKAGSNLQKHQRKTKDWDSRTDSRSGKIMNYPWKGGEAPSKDTEDKTRKAVSKRSTGIMTARGKLGMKNNSFTAKVKAKESFDLSDYTVEELEDFMMSEEFEQLDEVSKATLGSYIKKANLSAMDQARKSGEYNNPDQPKHFSKAMDRMRGIKKATDKLVAKEEVDLDEAVPSLSKAYMMKLKSDYHGKDKLSKGETQTMHKELGTHTVKNLKNIAGAGIDHVSQAAKQIVQKQFEPKFQREEVEQLDELSPDLKSRYAKKAATSLKRATTYKAKAQDDASKASKNIDRGYGGDRSVNIDKQYNRLDRADAKVDKHDKTIAKRTSGLKRANEEVEQLDELSPNTLHSYIKKAAGNMAGNAAVAAAQASSSMKKSSPDVKRKIKNRMTGITGASGRLADKANMSENWQEEIPMMMRQLEFIAYAAEEIMDYVDMAGDPEEWFQNKISGIHQSMLSMYAYAQGGRRAGYGFDESVELEEKLEKETIKHPVGQRPKGAGWVLKQAGEQTGKDHSVWERKFKRIVPSTTKEEVDLEEELKGGQKKLDHNKNGKLDAQDFHMMRKKKKVSEEAEQIDEISQDKLRDYHAKSALDLKNKREKLDKGTLTMKDLKKGQNRVKGLNRAADKMDEEVEILDEAFKQGIVKLKDGSSVALKKEDADLLNQMFKDLSSGNRSKMQEIAMKDKTGFEEILGFAREAL